MEAEANSFLQAHRYESVPGQDLPRLLILVTGKGPQKTMYLEKMRGLNLRRVAFRTLWLDPGDYPLLLGCCDAGVSLHTSSSGLDLPMKVSPRIYSQDDQAFPIIQRTRLAQTHCKDGRRCIVADLKLGVFCHQFSMRDSKDRQMEELTKVWHPLTIHAEIKSALSLAPTACASKVCQRQNRQLKISTMLPEEAWGKLLQV